MVVILLNWLAVLVVGGWQGAVHQVGPASCDPGHQEYFLCGAVTAVAKESILSSGTPEAPYLPPYLQSVFVPLSGKYWWC